VRAQKRELACVLALRLLASFTSRVRPSKRCKRQKNAATEYGRWIKFDLYWELIIVWSTIGHVYTSTAMQHSFAWFRWFVCFLIIDHNPTSGANSMTCLFLIRNPPSRYCLLLKLPVSDSLFVDEK
jgi:hypothetical protein